MPSPLLSYAEAADQVRRLLPQFRSQARTEELVSLAAAADRVLASDLRADRDQPPFPRSTRDGFACRAAEANTHPFLRVSGHIRAGESPSGVLEAGEAWEIMTGAPVPEGADAVFMVEHAEHSSDNGIDLVQLTTPRTVAAGENIVPKGSEAHAGDLLVPPGVRLSAAHIALAAQCGYARLAVAPRPTVAILSTGDELVSIEDTPGPSQIRNSNSPMLAALVSAAGAEPIILPAVPDQQAPLDNAIQQALSADLLLVTGGISAGRFDLVKDALTRAGASFFFGGVAIQPGKPVVFGQLPRPDAEALPFFALPGNPISSAVTFHLFAAPVLAALGRDSSPQPRFTLAQFAGEWRGKPGLTRFLPAWCDFGRGSTRTSEVRLIPWQGSGDIAAFARSNCFVVVPADAEMLPDGSLVQILLT
jgi:molybdopterin molybdotransferase